MPPGARRAERAMITRSLFHQRPRVYAARWSTPEPCSGAEAQGHLPHFRVGQVPGSSDARCVAPRRARPPTREERRREQAKRVTQSNNYWSATTNQNNPTNAWNVNFNNGNVNNDNKTNNNYVRGVRGGM